MSFDRKPASPITPHDAAKIEDQQAGQDGRSTPPINHLQIWAVRLPETYVLPVSGGIAGAVSGFVSCPLDVIKTKLQAQGGFQAAKDGVKLSTTAYHGVQGTAEMIWKEEGLKGMYRGLGPMLLGYVPTWAVYLTVYNKAQTYFRTKTDNWFLANIYASLTGGACSTMTTNPIWVIKTRLMSQSSSRSVNKHSRSPWHYRNTFDAARKMYRTEGILSFYSGLTPALLGLTHVAIQFPLYEVFKQKFTGLGGGNTETEDDRQHHFYGLAFAVFLSKVCASTATYPHEVVRTRLQTQQRSMPSHPSEGVQFRVGLEKAGNRVQLPGSASPDGVMNGLRYRGTVQTCKVILAEEGWRGFYAGLGTNLIRAVPSAMTTILTFEYLKKTYYDLQREGRTKMETLGPPAR
ncbi:hypothetical protein MMC07_008608 [Pseudocyphellaria aurata]|nr:hypothetical protein [Pseudocyphellaria aurata]